MKFLVSTIFFTLCFIFTKAQTPTINSKKIDSLHSNAPLLQRSGSAGTANKKDIMPVTSDPVEGMRVKKELLQHYQSQKDSTKAINPHR